MKCGRICLSHGGQLPVLHRRKGSKHFMNQATFHSAFPILVINKILGCLQYSAKHVFHLFYYARIAKLFLNLEILPYSYVQKYFWYSRILVRALIKI